MAEPTMDVPEEVIREIPELIINLKPGMSRTDVISSLGLEPYISSTLMAFPMGSGPLSNHSTAYTLKEGFILSLFFDITDSGGKEKFKNSSLLGDGWKKIRQ